MLVALRRLFVVFSVSLLGVGLVSLLLSADAAPDQGLDPVAATLGVGAVGAVLVIGSWAIRPRLSCSSPDELAASYRARFFLRLAFAEGAALVGFVAVIETGSALPYAAGFGWAAVGFLALAPTARHVERCQDELTLQGCPHRLLDALQTPSPSR